MDWKKLLPGEERKSKKKDVHTENPFLRKLGAAEEMNVS